MESINPLTVNPIMEQAQQTQELKHFKESGDALQRAAKSSLGSKGKDDAKLRDACVQFEAMFLDLMFKEMRKTVPKDSLLGDSNADDILRSMHDTQMTQDLAQAGGVGLADMLYRQISGQNTKPPISVLQIYKK